MPLANGFSVLGLVACQILVGCQTKPTATDAPTQVAPGTSAGSANPTTSAVPTSTVDANVPRVKSSGTCAASAKGDEIFLGPEALKGLYCDKHADCKAGKNGRCIWKELRRRGYRECAYDACLSDAECQAKNPSVPKDELRCYCGAGEGGTNVCGIGNCQKDGDCPAPFTCDGTYCYGAADECRPYPSPDGCHGHTRCEYDSESKHHKCVPITVPRPG